MSQPSNSSNPYGLQTFPVTTPAGSVLNLQTQEEADWYNDRCSRYQHDNQFPNVSDLQDLDRLLTLEILVFRWSQWMAQGYDYLYTRVEETQLKNNIREYSVETRLLKASLGIDKMTRDKVKSESLADYVENLLKRAKQFGYHRNDQYEMAVTKFYELRTMVMTYDRCDQEEREHLDLSPEKILEWIRDNVIKDWDDLAEAFRKEQSVWIRDQ